MCIIDCVESACTSQEFELETISPACHGLNYLALHVIKVDNSALNASTHMPLTAHCNHKNAPLIKRAFLYKKNYLNLYLRQKEVINS